MQSFPSPHPHPCTLTTTNSSQFTSSGLQILKGGGGGKIKKRAEFETIVSDTFDAR
jgi:hypothetical protein